MQWKKKQTAKQLREYYRQDKTFSRAYQKGGGRPAAFSYPPPQSISNVFYEAILNKSTLLQRYSQSNWYVLLFPSRR